MPETLMFYVVDRCFVAGFEVRHGIVVSSSSVIAPLVVGKGGKEVLEIAKERGWKLENVDTSHDSAE